MKHTGTSVQKKMRKIFAHIFPDPDLLPVEITKKQISEINSGLVIKVTLSGGNVQQLLCL